MINFILNRKTINIILALICFSYFVAGLWPFNFQPENKVEWLKNENGIRFYGMGIAFSHELVSVPESYSRTASITIELLVNPNKDGSAIQASILTLYDRDQEQFILGQWKNNFQVRIPVGTNDSSNRFRYIGIKNILSGQKPRLITVTSGEDRTTIYIDGIILQSVSRYSLIPGEHRLSGRFILGNSPNGRHPWNGSVLGMAIYDRALDSKEIFDHYHEWCKSQSAESKAPGVFTLRSESNLENIHEARYHGSELPIALYFFDEKSGEQIKDHSGCGNHLLTPAIFRPVQRVILEMPPRERWLDSGNLMDMAVNFFGFAPFGFFFTARLLQSKHISAPSIYGITVFLGFFMSLGIELSQIYLPSRDSSLLDLINNTLGTAAGVFCYRQAIPFLKKALVN